MNVYRDINGDSSILYYEIGSDYVAIVFSHSKLCYYYTIKSCGINQIKEMKRLAFKGDGLNSYIVKYCKDNYEYKKEVVVY